MEIDRENITKLSDDELFKTLRKCGLNVGPINKSTRSVYEKRLRNYLDGNSTISVADVTTTQAAPKEPVAVLTAASLNETFPRARPEPKNEIPAPVQPIKKSNPEPPRQTLLDDVNRISVSVRPSEPPVRVLQAETNGYSSSAAPSVSSRMSYEPLAKSVERKSNELDFKLIRPAAPTATASASSFVPTTSTSSTRREINYGLLDDKPTQPATLSSGYKLGETTTPNIRSRVTNLNNPKIETQYAKSTTNITTTKTAELKTKEKSSFKWTYYLLVAFLFVIVLIGMNFVGSNPENPVEFVN